MTDPTKPLAWISADLSSAMTARQVENIPELGGDPSALYPIPLYAGVLAFLARIEALEQNNNRLRSTLAAVRSNLVRRAQEENSVMIEGIDDALAAAPARPEPSLNWYWPADDTSSDACCDGPWQVAENADLKPRGGVERDIHADFQLLHRKFRKLEKAAREVLREVDASLKEKSPPFKYGAPFGPLTKLREALPETYEEFAAARTTLQEHAEDGERQGDEG